MDSLDHNFFMEKIIERTSLGERLKELIFYKEIKVEDLSKAIEVELSTIYKWIRNDAVPTFENLIKITDYFKCTVDFLVGRNNDNTIAEFNICPPYSIQFKYIMGKFKTNKWRLSKSVKISRSVFHYWLIGKSEPTLDNLVKLADYFDCSIDFLVGREK